jgi:predicted metal-binding protein
MMIQPQDISYRTFYDKLTGYRVSRLMLQAARSGIMEIVGPDGNAYESVQNALPWDTRAAGRFIDTLCGLGFLFRRGTMLFRSPFSQIYLSADSPRNQLNTLHFEEKLQDNWQQLEKVLTNGARLQPVDKSDEEYRQDLRLFLGAMDESAQIRSRELLETISPQETGTIMEIGAGSGAYLAAFLETHPGWQGIFCDLPDVVETIATDHRLIRLKNRMRYAPGNLLLPDDPMWKDLSEPVDLILASNFFHCQGEEENAGILQRLLPLLKPEGVVAIHDFFKDTGHRGALYDLHMMLNTYNGRVYDTEETASLLKSMGVPFISIHPLPSGSAVLYASRRAKYLPEVDPFQVLKRKATELGFTQAVAISPPKVPVARWVREKCRTGCPNYGIKGTCPPRTMEPEQMKTLLREFKTGILLVGEPPLRTYHENLLEMEKTAFKRGFHKALAFTGGPCTICDQCRPDNCRYPAKRRYSLESCGCDVFGLAKEAGIILTTLEQKTDYVQYISLLLLE